MKLKKLAVGIGMALSIVGGSANAALLSFEDDNIDFLLNADGTPKTSGSFQNGDILVSVFEINEYTKDGVNAIPAGMELTGVAAVQLTGGDGSLLTPWTFGATTQGLNTWLLNPLASDAGATIAMFLNPTADFDLDINFSTNVAGNCITLLDCIAKATTGSLLQVDGFAGDADEFWRSSAAIIGAGDVAIVGNLAGDELVASFNAVQTTLFHAGDTIGYRDVNTGLPCAAGTTALDNCIAGPRLSGPLQGGGGLNAGIKADGAFARSDFDLSKRTVPEPSVLALLGLGLLGVAMNRRRRPE